MKKLYMLMVALLVGIAANATTVYFQNTGNWSTVNAYAWSPDNKSWPGIALVKATNTITTTDGTEYWFYEIPGAQTKIIFNNGSGSQTKDLAATDGAVYSFAKNNNSGGTTDAIGTITKNGDQYVFTKAGEVVLTPGNLYFPVSTYNKSKAYLYTWSPQITAAWPGTQLDKVTLSNGEFWKLTIADDREITNATIGGWQLNTGDSSAQVEYTKAITVNPGYYVNILTGETGPVESYKDSDVKIPDWYNVWYNLVGGYNEWSTDAAGFQMTDMQNPVASWNNQAIGTTGFKVKAWRNNADEYYSAGGAVAASGEWISCPYDPNNAPDMTVENAGEDCVYNVEFNVETQQIKITLVSGTPSTPGKPDDPTPPTFGLVGDSNIQTAGEWDINNPVEMTANDNVWSTTYSSLPSGTKFKVAVSNTTLTGDDKWDDTYGAENNAENGGDVDVVLGEAMNAWLGSSNNWTIAEDLKDVTIAFTYVADGQSTITVTGTKSTPDEPTYPENMYVVGYVDGYSWNPTEGVKMTNEGDGIYTIEEIHITGSFALTTTLATDGNDWETMNNGRIGPDGSDVEAKEGENEATGRGDGKSWVIAAGTYKLTYTWDDEILEIELVELDPEIPVEKLFAICGTMQEEEWDETTAFEMQENAENVWSYTFETLTEGTEFKIINKNVGWDESYGAEGVYGSSDPVAVTLSKDMNAWPGSDCNWKLTETKNKVIITFTYNTEEGQASTLLVDIDTAVEGIEIDEAAPAEYYNLQGVRIAAPEKGLYIIRQGEKVTKILK